MEKSVGHLVCPFTIWYICKIILLENPKKLWDHFKKLGPKRSKSIPFEVYNDNGDIIFDKDEVLNKWASDFSKVYSPSTNSEFNSDFHEQVVKIKCELERRMQDDSFHSNDHLNSDITANELDIVIIKAENGKSCGNDKLPYEVLRYARVKNVLLRLFQLCLNTGYVPSAWKTAILSPIPKDSSKDPRIPTNYRSINLLSCVSKLYSSLLNIRLVSFLEDNNVIVEEQNGFRPHRSCLDHVFVTNSIVRTRILNKQHSFSAFIDFQKALDCIDRESLFYKLLINNVDGNFYNSIKSMYTNTSSYVRINSQTSVSFPCSSGVRQGDNLSPTLFNLYINDLARGLNELNKGIDIGGRKVCVLLYADDIILLAPTESDLQTMLDYTAEWCKKWRLSINNSKTNIVHFRPKRKPKSTSQFQFGTQNIEYASSYKYLGITLDEHLNFENCATILSQSGSRAMGAVISKIHSYKTISFKTYEKLYESCVVPITDYCSGVWGFKQFDKIDQTQNRAIRYFFGLHRFAPKVAYNGDIGWTPCFIRRWTNMVKLWNNLVSMRSDRLIKDVFEADYNNENGNWCSKVKSVFNSVQMGHIFSNKQQCNIKEIEQKLINNYSNDWSSEIKSVSKLRTYTKFKDTFSTETYVTTILSKVERSHLAQFRCGILPLRIETGRYTSQKIEDRLCVMCHSGSIEDEWHFLLHYNKNFFFFFFLKMCNSHLYISFWDWYINFVSSRVPSKFLSTRLNQFMPFSLRNVHTQAELLCKIVYIFKQRLS
ncbi:uncharacterized protein LOC126811173 isoform X1 [Patella vulgata]|uniref:uncharacterized protein LOC126811173 isoform X1 n=1 Tax=Patella vulgata TaxID=6465 RepID=UPI00217FBD4C|nr:uncharacterized protein LOC126811173 isoform X1 [Patella vulgata]XP_050392672.1 uncharacterized protein LOC126811173 isoform X1 [Patella vulgata]XP_050392673.1 uncharacterized protein LOC126811173 isoform X1 [Patella vulgata]